MLSLHAQAAELAASDRDVLDPELDEQIVELQSRLDSCRADYAFAEQAETVRLELFEGGKQFREQRYQGMETLYQKRGWSLFDDPDLAAKLRASPMRLVIQANLDDLASMRMAQCAKASDVKFQRLLVASDTNWMPMRGDGRSAIRRRSSTRPPSTA